MAPKFPRLSESYTAEQLQQETGVSLDIAQAFLDFDEAAYKIRQVFDDKGMGLEVQAIHETMVFFYDVMKKASNIRKKADQILTILRGGELNG